MLKKSPQNKGTLHLATFLVSSNTEDKIIKNNNREPLVLDVGFVLFGRIATEIQCKNDVCFEINHQIMI